MYISVVCCTYYRPRGLANILACWQAQTYPTEKRELLILDDAGQYAPNAINVDGCTLITIPRRFRTLGEKRNAIAGLASPQAEAYMIWDDDDIYLPIAIEATVAALQRAPLSRPSQVAHLRAENGAYILQRHWTGGLYHGQWGYTREVFERVGGYPYLSGPEDQGLLQRLEAIGVATADPIELGYSPFYVYAPWPCIHISWRGGGEKVWRSLPNEIDRNDKRYIRTLEPKLDFPYFDLPISTSILARPF